MILSRISLPFFLAAFCVGLLFCYVFTPPPQVVVKFPSPYNAGHVVYRDKADTCFKYRADKLDACPKDRSRVKQQPILEDYYGGAARTPSQRPPLSA